MELDNLSAWAYGGQTMIEAILETLPEARVQELRRFAGPVRFVSLTDGRRVGVALLAGSELHELWSCDVQVPVEDVSSPMQ